jgi:hypothetical protein
MAHDDSSVRDDNDRVAELHDHRRELYLAACRIVDHGEHSDVDDEHNRGHYLDNVAGLLDRALHVLVGAGRLNHVHISGHHVNGIGPDVDIELADDDDPRDKFIRALRDYYAAAAGSDYVELDLAIIAAAREWAAAGDVLSDG